MYQFVELLLFRAVGLFRWAWGESVIETTNYFKQRHT